MATFQVSKKNKHKTNKNLKLIFGWILLGISTFVFLFSATKLLPFLQHFFLGILGVFVYPLTVLGFIIALALLNDKKYVMPKKYAIFLSLSLFFFLCIIQLIIIGSPNKLSYSEYVSLNYTKQFTAGGMIIGFLPSSMAVLMGLPATYIMLSIAFAVCLAFFVEAVVSLRKTTVGEKPIKLQIKEEVKTKPVNPRENQVDLNPVVAKNKEEINVMYDGNKEVEEKRELTAREKLGLVGGYKQKVGQPYYPQEVKLPEDKKEAEVPTSMSMREYLLSPPKVDLDKFKQQQARALALRAEMNNSLNAANKVEHEHEEIPAAVNVSTSEINRNIAELKQEEIKPVATFEPEPVRQNTLPTVKPEEITNEAEDIIRSVVMQEKMEREVETDKDFISFDELETPAIEPKEVEEKNNEVSRGFSRETFSREEDIEETPKTDFSRMESREELSRNTLSRNEFSRESLSRNNHIEENNDEDDVIIKPEEKNDRLSRRDAFIEEEKEPIRRSDFGGNHNRQEETAKPVMPTREKPIDEMERRKRFVTLDDEPKKETKIKPYKYKRPALDLLTTVSDDPATFNQDMPMKRVALENVLENFGVPAKVQNVVVGPTVTRYEIEMPEGISVKKILSLDADIAYALSANGQIRIEAPIPGRSMVGIEVPNAKVAKVSVKDILQSKEFSLSPSPLTFALGKDITGNVKVCNLQKMPHLLVAGTTGSGKSVCLNTIITSLLYKSSPDEVKLILIDPKQVELSMYEGLPHMLIPKVITDPTKAVNALQWAIDEMERRFNLISEERVRNIDEYNKIEKVLQNKVKKMPFIVIIFDEFADFMAVAKNEIEDKIRRLAAKARAAGIHLILATQRPSTDVVTGTLKANMPARIAFKVAGRVDSEVIMGAPGAEKLLGYGDMLYKPADSSPQRLQGCLIETGETKDIVNFITENNEEIFDEEAFNAINNPNKSTGGNGANDNNGVDPLLPQALKICIDNGVASTTMVQRKLSIGYPRAARIVDQMEERGYIASAEGSKQRAVYISIEEFYTIFGDIYD